MPLSEADIQLGIAYVETFYGETSDLDYKSWFNDGKGMTPSQAEFSTRALAESPLTDWVEIMSIERERIRDLALYQFEGKALFELEHGKEIKSIVESEEYGKRWAQYRA